MSGLGQSVLPQSVKPVLCLLMQLLWMSPSSAAAGAQRAPQDEQPQHYISS